MSEFKWSRVLTDNSEVLVYYAPNGFIVGVAIHTDDSFAVEVRRGLYDPSAWVRLGEFATRKEAVCAVEAIAPIYWSQV